MSSFMNWMNLSFCHAKCFKTLSKQQLILTCFSHPTTLVTLLVTSGGTSILCSSTSELHLALKAACAAKLAILRYMMPVWYHNTWSVLIVSIVSQNCYINSKKSIIFNRFHILNQHNKFGLVLVKYLFLEIILEAAFSLVK